jgi:hypothetical protein
VPLKFWDESFLTATYLINITPSKVIDDHTPMDLLLHEQPDYKALRTSGCACWPNLICAPLIREKFLSAILGVCVLAIVACIKG